MLCCCFSIHTSALLLLHGFYYSFGALVGPCIVKRKNGPYGSRYPAENRNLQNQTEETCEDFPSQKK